MRVLVAEDSGVTREYLTYLLEQDPEIKVVGVASDGRQAVQQAERLRPDVILMDVYMPGMNGFAATRRIMERFAIPIVLMSAGFNHDEVHMTFEALRAGALTMVEKPVSMDDPRHQESVRQLIQTLKLMGEVKVVTRRPAHPSVQAPLRPESPVPTPGPAPAEAKRSVAAIRAVAVGASTGGPAVLAEILSRLPDRLPVPILVVQHIAADFANGLVDWLQQSTPLTITLARAGAPLRPATVYVAPPGHQMGVSARGQVELDRGTDSSGFCPSADHLFHSLAKTYGRCAAGVLLTGMGQDGAEGLLAIQQAGGVTIVQDAESCVVYGMPGAAIRIGAAQHVLPPTDIARTLARLTQTP